MGQQVYAVNDLSTIGYRINTSEWPQGLYVVRVNVAGKTKVSKVLISR